MLKRMLPAMLIVVLAGACLAAAPSAAPAPSAPAPAKDETSPYLWKPKVTSVAVFKNGLGFFMREGAVALRDGWCLAPQVPPAAFGTLAVFAHEENQFVDIVGSGPGEVVEFDGVDASDNAAAVRARLEECRYLKVELKYRQDSSERSAAGVLRSVGPDYAILESDSSTFAVPLEGVKRLQVLELPVRVHVAADEGRKAERTKLGMAYLRKGVTWIPEYTLKILDDDTAELTLRGTLVNEAEDLVHCDVHFVVGVPHFIHTDYLAPIAVGQLIRTVGAAVAPREIQSQMMNRAAIVSNEASRAFDVLTRPAPAEGGDLGRALGGLPQIEAAAGTDYTVYTRKDLTVRCGEKAIVTLFRKTIRYGHIYRWDIPGTMQHFLVLHNSTDTAWTTGPYLAVSQGQPLSEDLLKYVPKGGSGEIPVTAAINIAQDQTETEVDRKLKAHSPSDNFYLDLVTLRGELMLKNLEKREVGIVITLALPGVPTEATDDGAITVDTSKLKILERAGSIRWLVKLKAGETKKLSYSYQRYVPSR